MPKVPVSGNVVPIRPEDGPSPTDFAMAAAVMHEEGRLFDPTPFGPLIERKRPLMTFTSPPLMPKARDGNR